MKKYLKLAVLKSDVAVAVSYYGGGTGFDRRGEAFMAFVTLCRTR